MKDYVICEGSILKIILSYFSYNLGVSIIPAWHATRKGEEVINSICSTGFASLALTDAGYFGRG
jgi:hypothetical protein